MDYAWVDSTIQQLACAIATANCSLDENLFAIPAKAQGIKKFISLTVLKWIIHRRRQAISSGLKEQEKQGKLGIVDSICSLVVNVIFFNMG